MSLELSVTRLIDAPRETVYRALTERMEEWFAPKLWRFRVVELDLRPGGRFASEMLGPDGESNPGDGVVLEVVPNESLMFTDAFSKGWVPSGPFMVGFFRLEDEGGKTRYTAGARHWTEEARSQHAEMGFETGWGAVADQLAELAEEMARTGQ